MKKSNVLHTPSPPHTEHYAAFERSGVLTRATTWVFLKTSCQDGHYADPEGHVLYGKQNIV